MLLYHGSNIEVSNPQIIESDRRLDFGKGFYLTSSYEQAKRWAELTVKRRGSGKESVSVFEFDDSSVSDLKILHFTQAQKEWLEWYYTEKEVGYWKRCSRCGQIKLGHSKFFSKNKSSKDGWYSICKECRNKK